MKRNSDSFLLGPPCTSWMGSTAVKFTACRVGEDAVEAKPWKEENRALKQISIKAVGHSKKNKNKENKEKRLIGVIETL